MADVSFWQSPRPTQAFTAKYSGRCALDTCERRGEIEPGDAVRYIDNELMHSRCANRTDRGDTNPLCTKCYCYHVGDCL